MSKQTVRRAAERQARKEERNQNLTVEIPMTMAAGATESRSPYLIEPIDLAVEDASPVPAPASIKTSASEIRPDLPTTRKRRYHFASSPSRFLSFEDPTKYHALAVSMYSEHDPQTDAEQRLVDSMIQSYWLKERAIHLQEEVLIKTTGFIDAEPRQLGLFIRYQAIHERSYYKALRELQNLRKENRKAEIGFESQNRQQEAHEARVRLTHARARNLEIDTACRQTMEAPIPGNERIGFEQLTKACSTAIATVVYENQFKTAAK